MPPCGLGVKNTAEISFIIISKVQVFVKGIFQNCTNFFGHTAFEVISVKFWKKTMLFALGGAAYMGIEVLWRGWSHGSMFLAGGISFLAIGHLDEIDPRLPLPARAFAGAAIITTAELAAGLLFNRSYTVWDYRAMPLNFHGQICLPFTLLWIPMSLFALWAYGLLSRSIDRHLGENRRVSRWDWLPG